MNEILTADRVINVNSVFDRFSIAWLLPIIFEKVPQDGAQDNVFIHAQSSKVFGQIRLTEHYTGSSVRLGQSDNIQRSHSHTLGIRKNIARIQRLLDLH